MTRLLLILITLGVVGTSLAGIVDLPLSGIQTTTFQSLTSCPATKKQYLTYDECQKECKQTCTLPPSVN